MNQDKLKKAAAKAVLELIPEDAIIGVGTGTTVNYFIDLLNTIKHNIAGAVASSQATAKRLQSYGIPTFDLTAIPSLPLYIDSADAYNPLGQLVKGGGGALTGEKILASAADRFICIVDDSKATNQFGAFPIPIEVIPMARSVVAREITKLKGKPVYRQHALTDYGNHLIDVHGWSVVNPLELEQKLNSIPGVVENGFFAKHPADQLIIAHTDGIETVNTNKLNN